MFGENAPASSWLPKLYFNPKVHGIKIISSGSTYKENYILYSEVKWALRSTATYKASGDDGIPAELFKNLKVDTVKVLHSICQQIWKTQQWPKNWKRSVFIPIPKKGNAKQCLSYHTNVFISNASRVILKILHARLQQHVIQELPNVQAGFRKVRGTRDQMDATSAESEKAREFKKKSLLLFNSLC